MKKLLVACIFFAGLQQAPAERYSTEDESRFRDQPYTKVESGMLAPAAYIERAKKALRSQFSDIRLVAYEAPFVSRRLYADAPATDRDIICVHFLYKELIKPPPSAAKRLPNLEFMARPALLVLMRKDLSKIYVNEVFYQIW
jgi:hypothetical protein